MKQEAPLKYSVGEPNFSILLPGGCNAKCSFCFAGECKKPLPVPAYVKRLHETLTELPDEFTSVSLTGGEPTISKYLKPTLMVLALHKKRIKKVVMTTNGTRLMSCLDEMIGVVDHLNLSMHHYDAKENKKIFGGSYDRDHDTIHSMNHDANKAGIDVTANCVFNLKTPPSFFAEYIEVAKRLGFSAVHFRKENGNLKTPANWNKAFGDHTVTGKGGCPACRTTWIRAGGIPVALKTSVLEPDTALDADTIHELIFHGDGKLYSNWAGTREVVLADGRVWNQKNAKVQTKTKLVIKSKKKSIVEKKNAFKKSARSISLSRLVDYSVGCGRSSGCGRVLTSHGCGSSYSGGCR
jgi:uncharacterized Fe-S cluster-containing radical SAM superfamily protein